jgi:hypothetical protein
MKALVTHPTDFLGRRIVPDCYVVYPHRGKLAVLRVHATIPKEGYHLLLGVDTNGRPKQAMSTNCVIVQL